jgi:hypothetical protein
MLIFDLFRPRTGWLRRARGARNRYRLRGGPRSAWSPARRTRLPREWARAWQVARAGRRRAHGERAAGCGRVRRELQDAGRQSASIGRCLKRALHHLGVIRCAAVAPGTPALAPEHAGRVRSGLFDRVREQA